MLAGMLFTSEDLSYRESLFIIGVTVIVVSVISFLLSLSRRSAQEILSPEFHPDFAGHSSASERRQVMGVKESLAVTSVRKP